MDTRNRPSDDWEKQAALQEWIDTLDSFGVDTKKILADEHELIRKALQVNISWQRYLEEKPDSVNAAAHKAAEDPDDFDAFTNTIVAGALAADPAVHERLRTIVGRAGAIAAAAAYRAFRSRGEGAYKILAPVLNSTRDGILETGPRIPDGVMSLDSAARVGVEQDWLKLEALVARWHELMQLIEAWYVAGVFDTSGRNLEHYNPWMFVYRDYEQAINTYGSDPIYTARQVANGDAQLLTIDEVDELGSTRVRKLTPDEAHAAQRSQHRADEEAAAILRAEWEANGISPRLAAASAKRSR